MTTNAPSPAHTAGPWIFDESAHEDTGLLIFAFDVHREPLDHVYNPETGRDEPVYRRIAIAELDRVPEMEANARLIAAAPDLLKMVRSARVAFLERILGIEEEKKELLDPDDFADQDIIDNYQWLIDRCDEVLAKAGTKST